MLSVIIIERENGRRLLEVMNVSGDGDGFMDVYLSLNSSN